MTEQDYSAGVAFIDSQYVPVAEAKIPVTDWGFLHSDATYDVVHVWGGRFFRLNDHLDRFLRGAAKLRLTTPHDRAGLIEILMECVRRTGLKNAYVEMIVTRGVPTPGSRDPRTATNRFIAFAIPFIWVANEEQRTRGLDLAVSNIQRISPASVDPTIKNYHWLDLTMALIQALETGRETVILVDQHGDICEGPGFNLFTVNGNVLTTPGRGVLEGITRKTVLELAPELGLTAKQAPINRTDLETAAEVFITSTAGGVMPIAKVDGAPVGSGKPGPVYQKMHDLYWARHDGGDWTMDVGY